jgi:hypothetical protein
MSVFLVWWETGDDDVESVTLIGCFSSHREALVQKEFAAELDHFRNPRSRFVIDEMELNEVGWKSGFFTWR